MSTQRAVPGGIRSARALCVLAALLTLVPTVLAPAQRPPTPAVAGTGRQADLSARSLVLLAGAISLAVAAAASLAAFFTESTVAQGHPVGPPPSG